MPKVALLVVDVQNDFCPGGALAVKNGDEVVPGLNRMIDLFTSRGLPVFYTRDWHPANHVSFRARGGPWPPHCVQGTRGAELHPGLKVAKGAQVIDKGNDPDLEAYSGFEGTDLARRLHELGVEGVIIGGLTTDYCVKQSSLDAIDSGFKVEVLKDCIRGVNVHRNDSSRAIKEIMAKGARVLSSAAATKSIENQVVTLHGLNNGSATQKVDW